MPIGNGSEEIEATTIADTLVRAGGEVTIASVESDLVCTMSRGVKIMADKSVADCTDEEYDLIALPASATPLSTGPIEEQVEADVLKLFFGAGWHARC